jgi:aspartate racemase
LWRRREKPQKKLGLRRLGLFGIRFTMQGHFYRDVFAEAGIDLIVPDVNEQAYIHDIYMNELLRGVFLPETREDLLAIANRQGLATSHFLIRLRFT